MPATYLDLTCHIIFATKHRQPWIADSWRGQLHAYIGGMIRNMGASAYSGENEQPIRLKASIVSGENEHIIR